MTVSDYQVSLPYGSTDSPYSTLHPHRGRDYGCPSGTPLVIGGQQIGLSGATGHVLGAHCHVQEWENDYANTREPQNAFKPGTVTNIDPTGTQGDGSFGKFITIQTADGWNDSYCHLSEIDVNIGDIIGGEMELANQGDVENIFLSVYDLKAEQGDIDYWLKAIADNKFTFKDLFYAVVHSDRYNTEHFINDGDVGNLKAKGIDLSSVKGKMWKEGLYNGAVSIEVTTKPYDGPQLFVKE